MDKTCSPAVRCGVGADDASRGKETIANSHNAAARRTALLAGRDVCVTAMLFRCQAIPAMITSFINHSFTLEQSSNS